MKTIHKFHIKSHGLNVIVMPMAARILTAQIQNSDIMLWALVDTDARPISRILNVALTGEEIIERDLGEYIATVQSAFGTVMRIFDKGEIL